MALIFNALACDLVGLWAFNMEKGLTDAPALQGSFHHILNLEVKVLKGGWFVINGCEGFSLKFVKSIMQRTYRVAYVHVMPMKASIPICVLHVHKKSFWMRMKKLLITSVMFGFLGMKIATYINAQTTLESRKGCGKIARMRLDQFGPYTESLGTALTVISTFGIDHDLTVTLYPLLVSLGGVIGCLLTILFATDFFAIKAVKEIIGFVIEYFTSNVYNPKKNFADSCHTGAAINDNFSLALGYKSVIIPIVTIAINISVGVSLAAMYGIMITALGMLSTAKVTAATIRSALVSLTLLGDFRSWTEMPTDDVLIPIVVIGLLGVAMFSLWFSVITMKSVGTAALKMDEEVCRQLNTIFSHMKGTMKPNYVTSDEKITTDATIMEMIPPGALVMLTL